MLKWTAVACVFVSVLVAGSAGRAQETVSVTDVTGRPVEVRVPVDAMILGEGRFLPIVGILDRDDPTRRVVGMMGDFEQFDPTGYARYAAKFPGLDDIVRIGHASEQSFNLEQAIALSPDVAIFGLGSGHGPGARSKEVIDRLNAAGIPVVVVDFRIDPLGHTPDSIRLLGRLLGRVAEAEEFLAYYDAQIGLVRERLAGVASRPSVFMEIHVGLRETCCTAMGRDMMGQFIEVAGGRNHVGEQIPGTHGAVSLEQILADQPDVYIGTAIGSPAWVDRFPDRIVLGVGANQQMARASLRRAADRPGVEDLTAVQEGRMHAIWHHFYNSPFHVAAVQIMAKWFHPDLFADVEPERTLQTLHGRFQPIPLDGTYWISLEGQADRPQ